MAKENKTINDQDKEIQGKRRKMQKPDVPVWDSGWSDFLRTDRV
jgi:hypothetical protein